MLELRGVTYTVNKDGAPADLLHDVSLCVPKSHFMAIVGPSGCGKTTLLKLIAGILEESEGTLLWEGRDLAVDAELDLAEVGYVPQFSVAYEHLTVLESVQTAVELRVAGAGRSQARTRALAILEQTGLEDLAGRRVKVLSGGQKRRLGLALELVSDPRLLLCDEVTSGLDPRSEGEIVRLLHALSRVGERIVINVTHSLAHLDLYDSILVLYEGRAVYHGDPQSLDHYFSVEQTEEVYPTLARRDGPGWHESWQKHRDSYYRAAGLEAVARLTPPSAAVSERDRPVAGGDPAADRDGGDETADIRRVPPLPGPWRQFMVLLRRRFTIFRRDGAQWWLQLALVIGFPSLVVLFTPGLFEAGEGLGIPPMRSQITPSEIIGSENATRLMQQAQEIAGEQFRLGVLISGLVMFQVILLSLMGSNNGAREVVAERPIFEKEKLAGLSPFSYLLSKAVFLGLLVLVQSAWMAAFVHHWTVMPGSFAHAFVLLFLTNAAITTVCLAISSLARSTEQASLLSVYLVGFQLPLSNAVLALPAAVALITQPFIAAYWGWAGQLDHIMKTTAYDVGIVQAIPTSPAPFEVCAAVLAAHVAAGLFVAYVGVHRHRWD